MEVSSFIAVVVNELVHCFLGYFINQSTVEIVNNIPSLRLLSYAIQYNSTANLIPRFDETMKLVDIPLARRDYRAREDTGVLFYDVNFANKVDVISQIWWQYKGNL